MFGYVRTHRSRHNLARVLRTRSAVAISILSQAGHETCDDCTVVRYSVGEGFVARPLRTGRVATDTLAQKAIPTERLICFVVYKPGLDGKPERGLICLAGKQTSRKRRGQKEGHSGLEAGFAVLGLISSTYERYRHVY